MIEIALVVSRWMQFAAAAILCGVPAFYLYGLPRPATDDGAWLRRLLLGATLLGVIAAGLLLLAQTAEMSGDEASAFKPDVVWAVVSDTFFGAVWIVRLIFLVAMGALMTVLPNARATQTVLGALIAASLAWMGHRREGEGALGQAHLVADVLHLIAASVWIGALIVLLRLVARARLGGGEERTVAARALSRFSGMGSLVVATLILTGVINAWALSAPHSLAKAINTDYARVLLIKIGLFALMSALAALNRFSLAPRLTQAANEEDSVTVLVSLRRNILLETGLAALVLIAVAALGVMEPPSAL
jgi:putative copper resistance protein D